MHKLIILLITLSAITFSQTNPNALGLRGGGGNELTSFEFSYQYGLGEENRIEFDLGIGNSEFVNSTIISAIYHWNWILFNDFTWFVGPGASLSSFRIENAANFTSLGIGGQIGIDYDFEKKYDVPILISLDVRPIWDFIGDDTGLNTGAAFSIRYIWK